MSSSPIYKVPRGLRCGDSNYGFSFIIHRMRLEIDSEGNSRRKEGRETKV